MTRVSAMIRPPLFIGSAVAVKCPQSRQLVSPVIMRVSSMSSHPEKQRRLSPRTLKLAIDLPQVRILCHLILPLRHFDHILTITVNRERERWWGKGESSQDSSNFSSIIGSCGSERYIPVAFNTGGTLAHVTIGTIESRPQESRPACRTARVVETSSIGVQAVA
jgi:hypothetical protein